MKNKTLENLLAMRLAVGYLGERERYGWWPTAFFEASSDAFLAPVFTKTSRLAKYHGVLEAARCLHDEHLSVGCFHLFRLPEETEQDLYELLRSESGKDFLGDVTESERAATDALARLSSPSAEVSPGPLEIGKVRDADLTIAIGKVAAAYSASLAGGFRTYPYWAG